MSLDANSKGVASKESHAASSNNNNNKNNINDGANGNVKKMTLQYVNYPISPELQRNEAAARVKSTIQRVNDEDDDPCLKKKKSADDENKPPAAAEKFRRTIGNDPRFQQTNQTLRCSIMYEDFYRCEKILGDGHEACTWFRDVFTTICPIAWVERWDEMRKLGRLPWSRANTQGDFPGDRYGV